MQLWSRAIDHASKHERNYQKLEIEDKESYKWLLSAQQSQRCLACGGVTMTTHIGDRESDLFEEFATVPDEHNHILIRACQDRRLLGQSVLLYEYLSQQLCEGTYTINVPADVRAGRAAREALVMVRRALVEIQRPDKLNAFNYPSSVNLYAVEAVEVNPPADAQPIHWSNFPTHTVVCLEQALKIIEWYRWRWRIEQLFATLKKAGLNIEATQLESVNAIKRLTVLALSIAVRVLQMVEGRDNPDLPDHTFIFRATTTMFILSFSNFRRHNT